MHAMTKMRPPKRSVARVMVHMKTNDVCARIHNAGQMRIGSIESRAVHPRSMRASPNQEARLLCEVQSELMSDERKLFYMYFYFYMGYVQSCKSLGEGIYI
jgi:hypothetical protein